MVGTMGAGVSAVAFYLLLSVRTRLLTELPQAIVRERIMADDWSTPTGPVVVDDDDLHGGAVVDDWDASSDEEEVAASASVQRPAPVKKPAAAPVKQPAPARPKYVEPSPEEVAKQIRANRLADAEDLFGASDRNEARATQRLDEKLDELALASEDDYREFAANVAKRIEVERRGNTKRMTFLKELLKAASDPLSIEEINELKSALTVVYNQKNKVKQAATKKKKSKKAGRSLNVGGGGIFNEDEVDGAEFYEEEAF
ncbi:unnamed protein product (mitochondrion) [Plasmodiophora brassicae]|uniref:Uncharacterized protein n=1 Tax=Plasmodiophora brassicae TaxID=37360 RepID=A0A0G4IUA3_PLABS|nr:hypothetical protein PBRA_006785 [Plasmodiophora brassicae]SPR00807.1 unnamed protein product [Plasmodiophora brassicae]